MGTPASQEAQPLLAAGRRPYCWQQRSRAGTSAALALTWAQKGAKSRGPPPCAIGQGANTPANGRPGPGANLHLIGMAQAASDLLTSDARRPCRSATVWVATGSTRRCLEPALRRTRPWRCDGQPHPGTPTLVPGPGSGQPGLDGVPGSRSETAHLRMPAGPLELWLQREDGQQTRAQRAPRPLCLQLAAAPGSGAAADATTFCTYSSKRSAFTPWPSIERRLRLGGLGRILWCSLQPRSPRR